ncbi:hypothetical protein [Mesorhizobium sp. 113-3-9]|uniref:hypothetical protein n=1 Tax=Mesorhizobium sp. 113-3-9 TaxID=2744517 RepID=UPI001928EFDD|nr:hypothetical protein [Mesorhizobium sp. 113-3-9]
MDRFFGKAFMLAMSSIMAVSAASADAYVNQLDQSTGGQGLQQMSTGTGPAYIRQLPADSRPAVVRSQKNRPNAAAQSRAHELAARKRFAYPNVGPGVSLALAAANADKQMPTVGRGVVKR